MSLLHNNHIEIAAQENAMSLLGTVFSVFSRGGTPHPLSDEEEFNSLVNTAKRLQAEVDRGNPEAERMQKCFWRELGHDNIALIVNQMGDDGLEMLADLGVPAEETPGAMQRRLELTEYDPVNPQRGSEFVGVYLFDLLLNQNSTVCEMPDARAELVKHALKKESPTFRHFFSCDSRRGQTYTLGKASADAQQIATEITLSAFKCGVEFQRTSEMKKVVLAYLLRFAQAQGKEISLYGPGGDEKVARDLKADGIIDYDEQSGEISLRPSRFGRAGNFSSAVNELARSLSESVQKDLGYPLPKAS